MIVVAPRLAESVRTPCSAGTIPKRPPEQQGPPSSPGSSGKSISLEPYPKRNDNVALKQHDALTSLGLPCPQQRHVRRAAGAGRRRRANAVRRYIRFEPCPVRGPFATAPRGAGARCCGFALSSVAFSSLPELAGALPDHPKQAYRHVLGWRCSCGRQHSRLTDVALEVRERRATSTSLPELREAVYRFLLESLPAGRSLCDELGRRGLNVGTATAGAFRHISWTIAESQRLFRELRLPAGGWEHP